MNEIAPIITALAALILAWGNYKNGQRIDEVKHEVKTGNSQTLAQLADAVETRRIGDIPGKDRTPLEKSHLTEVEES